MVAPTTEAGTYFETSKNLNSYIFFPSKLQQQTSAGKCLSDLNRMHAGHKPTLACRHLGQKIQLMFVHECLKLLLFKVKKINYISEL
jgi:hypothetical protein